jgi:hypothetical protein
MRAKHQIKQFFSLGLRGYRAPFGQAPHYGPDILVGEVGVFVGIKPVGKLIVVKVKVGGKVGLVAINQQTILTQLEPEVFKVRVNQVSLPPSA